ncbi:MAG TPA: GNAT family N-acetyltransferase [Longimicrobiales bacterium]|nr:GNAT family N-acetyltransferase [Longimicrobiales bacterium]
MITLRSATPDDLDLLRRWDEEPHVIASDPNDDWDWETELYRSPDWREQLIAEYDGRPIAFIQIIDPAREDSHYWGEVPDGLRAIDIWIGESADLGRGHGTAIMEMALARCFADDAVTAVLVDPLAANTRAHAFYERLGFRFVECRRFGADECFVYRLKRANWPGPRNRPAAVAADTLSSEMKADLDAAIATLRSGSTDWAHLPVPRKIALLEGMRDRIATVAQRWVDAGSTAKGIPFGSPWRGEEWVSGPWALAIYVDALRDTLEHVARGTTEELVKGRIRQRPDGQTVVRVTPYDSRDRLLLGGYGADVWLEPGVRPDDVRNSIASLYRQEAPAGTVALVLGAGNIAAIAPSDMLYKLYVEGRVCILKLNPVNGYLGPLLEEVFREHIDAGFVRIVDGGADVGEYLARHDEVDEIHLTGSAATHDAVVYGAGEEGRRRKARDEPAIDKPVTSELGGVSPVIVVPGPWTTADVEYQAEHVATMKLHNSGFNCVATQVLVVPSGWPRADALLDAIRVVMDGLPHRPAYYPGAGDRMRDICDAYPESVERLGPGGLRVLVEVPAHREDEHAFRQEYFCAALGVTRLEGGGPAADPAQFLDAAVDFCNDRLMGTLSVTILVHPATMRALGDRLDDAIARLRYGTIGINVWSAFAFLHPRTSWGAFPGHARTDIQSGTGVVRNALLLDRPQKTVAWGPWAPFPRSLRAGERHIAPKPPWFVTNRTAATTARRLTAFTTSPRLHRLPGILTAALRG